MNYFSAETDPPFLIDFFKVTIAWAAGVEEGFLLGGSLACLLETKGYPRAMRNPGEEWDSGRIEEEGWRLHWYWNVDKSLEEDLDKQ